MIVGTIEWNKKETLSLWIRILQSVGAMPAAAMVEDVLDVTGPEAGASATTKALESQKSQNSAADSMSVTASNGPMKTTLTLQQTP